jgi:hypothetical protein
MEDVMMDSMEMELAIVLRDICFQIAHLNVLDFIQGTL